MAEVDVRRTADGILVLCTIRNSPAFGSAITRWPSCSGISRAAPAGPFGRRAGRSGRLPANLEIKQNAIRHSYDPDPLIPAMWALGGAGDWYLLHCTMRPFERGTRLSHRALVDARWVWSLPWPSG